MSAKQISRLAILASLCIALRLAFSPFPNVKPITAIFFLLATYFSLMDSLIVMVLTMTVTGLLMGFGPWIWWQIISYTILLIFWVSLTWFDSKKIKNRLGETPQTVLMVRQGKLRRHPFDFQRVFTFFKQTKRPLLEPVLAGTLAMSYGALVAIGDSWQYGVAWLPYWLNGLWFDFLHGISTFFFFPILDYIFWRIFTHEKNIDHS